MDMLRIESRVAWARIDTLKSVWEVESVMSILTSLYLGDDEY